MAEPPEEEFLDVSNKERAVARRIAQFGDAAVNRLVPLLSDPNDDVAQIAAAALRDVSRIDKKHLQKIIEALDSKKDLGWLPPALGRIDSPLAAEEAVKRLLVSKSAPHNQEAYAVKLSGIRAIPYIIKAAEGSYPSGRRLYYTLGYVLGEMDADTKAEAAKGLMRSISSGSHPDKIKAGMIYMIGFLKQPALVVESQLISLKENNTGFGNVIDQALIGIGSKKAGAIFAKQLSIKPDRIQLRDLAETGPAGIDAGPVVTGLLNHSDWEVRLAAARCLGFIGFRDCVPKLVDLLVEPSDVRLNWAAAESLGLIGDKASVKRLSKISVTHWHPAVRIASSKAVERIKSAESNKFRSHKRNFAFDFFRYSRLDIQACKETALKKIKDDPNEKLIGKDDKEKLKSLSYSSVIVGYDAADREQQIAADPEGIIEVRSDNMIKKEYPIKQIPDVAVKTKNGWIAGSNRGEWGGELVYIADGKTPVNIMNDNIKNIFHFGDRYIVVAGLAHLSTNKGMIYEVNSDGKGGWLFKRWRALPGAPASSWLVKTGELLVNTSGGGTVLISHNGSMRMAECRSYKTAR